MKLALLVAVMMASCGGAPAHPASSAPTPVGTFSMKPYFLVLLHVGPAWTAEKTPESTKLFEGHMANIKAMAKTGKLVIAGPTEDDEANPNAIAGIFVFDVATRAEVEELLTHDPAIAGKRFVPQILPWYTAAGITYPGKEGQ